MRRNVCIKNLILSTLDKVCVFYDDKVDLFQKIDSFFLNIYNIEKIINYFTN